MGHDRHRNDEIERHQQHDAAQEQIGRHARNLPIAPDRHGGDQADQYEGEEE